MHTHPFVARIAIPVVLVVASVSSARAEPIGFIERYALAEDRAVLLQELIVGSEDYYYYHCLHYQVTGQLELAAAMLRRWEHDPPAYHDQLLQSIRDRQKLLTYGATPDATIRYLRDRLNVNLSHSPPPTRGERRYPNQFDTSQLEEDRLIEETLRSGKQLKRPGLRRLAERLLAGDAVGLPVDLSWLLQQIDGPWVEQLDRLVIMELQQRRPQQRQFGDLAAHHHLTLSQLRDVASTVPEIAASDALVAEVLLRLRPSADVDLSVDQAALLEYLERADGYVQTLPPAYNSLKAAILYRRLEALRDSGDLPLDLFLRYLRLPRQSPIWHGEVAGRTAGPQANLSQDFMQLALVPAIVDEQPLVRDYLEHFLRDAADTDTFDGLLRPEYLRRVFAESKLLYGVGDPEQWFRMLSPHEQQQLKERVELTLAESNPQILSLGESTDLVVDVKNVDELVIRIYEINTHSYYRTHDDRIDTDVDLDGLQPTYERRVQYDRPDVRRHREAVELPEIEGRGVWVVDLLGGGLRTRALLRRGDLQYVLQQRAGGVAITALDEQRQVIPDAELVVGSQRFTANEQGLILMPPMDEAVTRKSVLMDRNLAVPVRFDHPAESYRWEVAMHVDPQQLLPGRMAQLLIRTRLYALDAPVDPTGLKDVTVTVVATDQEGIQTTRRFEDVEIDVQGELTVEFRVPARLRKIEATLSAQVPRVSDGRQASLSASDSWQTSGTADTSVVYDGYLTRDRDDWKIEVRGRNGEPVAGATVDVRVFPEVRHEAVHQTLQADDSGVVNLGPLPGGAAILWTVAGQQRDRSLDLDTASWPARVYATSDETIQLPLAASDTQQEERFGLFELRDGRPLSDLTTQLESRAGMLMIPALEPANYRLLDAESGRSVEIAITEGAMIDGVAVGEVRHLQAARRDAVGIESVERSDEGLRIRLSGDAPFARVHVLASRYLPDRRLADALQLGDLPLSARRVHPALSGYVSDLPLGEEYQYVLRRQYAKKYPGVMLPQPSLLLNPWETETTENVSQSVAEGAPPPASAAPEPGAAMQDRALQAAGSEAAGPTPSYEFLSHGAVLVANLVPDEEGVVTVPADLLRDQPLVQIVVCDPSSLVARTISGALPTLDPRDLRLTNSLPADKPLTLRRSVLVAGPDSPLDLSQLGTAQYQMYSSVGELLGLYITLADDPRLSNFVKLGSWHTLDDEAKRQFYGQYASHELHLFLKQYDSQFFDAVIRPYLANKKEKRLVDLWLLDEDLQDYTEQWRYDELNAAEKALLARQLESFRETVLREFRERIELMEPSPELMRRLVETGLSGRTLEREMDFFDKRLDERAARGRPAEPQQNAYAFEALGKPLNLGAGVAEAESGNAAADRLGIRMERLQQLRRSQARDADYFGGIGGGVGGGYGNPFAGREFFQHLEATKQWAESNWDHVRVAEAGSDLIAINGFWLDVARGVEVSEHLLRPTENRHAALAAIAFSGLPLEAQDISLPQEDDAAQFAPQHNVAIITKRLTSVEERDAESTLLVGQRFEAVDGANGDKDGEAKVAPKEYITGTAYRGQIILTNPTPTAQSVDVLWQIPAGSVPVAGGQATDSKHLKLEAFAVQKIEYQFYFPAAGTFEHYPVSVSADDELVARGTAHTFRVLEEPSETDEQSWQRIARSGSAERIEQFLRGANLRKIDLTLVAHRMRDRAVYDAVLGVLDVNNVWQPELYGYALYHQDDERIETLLSKQDALVASVGPVFQSQLLSVDPIDRFFYEHLEYAPLVRARIHSLRDRPEILNDRFMQQYRQLMRIVAHQRDIQTEQRLALAYYMLIQNRITESLEYFSSVERDESDMQLQYDYLAAYLALHRGDVAAAEELAARHAGHPVPRWRERFAELQQQLRQQTELSGGERLVAEQGRGEIPEDAADLAVLDRERQQAAAAAEQPAVDIAVEGNRLRIRHRNAPDATLNIYGVDLELLFSKTPFVQEDLSRMAMVRPMSSKQIELEETAGLVTYQLEEGLARQTLLVEVVAGPARDTALYYGGRLATYVAEGFGQLQVTDENRGAPVAGAYVKVYARHHDGEVRFYKDGYTDLRGRFDYASLSTPDLATTSRFAILVLDPELGATLHDVAPPTR